MKRVMTLLLSAALLAAAGASPAAIHYECKQASGKCPPPQEPPVPPVPPAPPVPPVPAALARHAHSVALPAPPAPPARPAFPAPPPPPAIPEVPDAAHAACAAQAPGARITHSMGKGETMDGICERDNGKMVFQLRAYRLAD